MRCGILSLPRVLPVAVHRALWQCVCAESSAVALSPHCRLLRPGTAEHHSPGVISNLFSFVGFPAFSCSRSKSPWTGHGQPWDEGSAALPGIQVLLFSWIHGTLASCQDCEMVPPWAGGRGSRDLSELGTGDTAEAVTLLRNIWTGFSAGRPRLLPSVTFLHVRFHLLFLLAYVCFVGVLLRVKWLKIHKWREIIQTACDFKPPFQLQIES